MHEYSSLSYTQQLYYSFWNYFNECAKKEALFSKEFSVKSSSTSRGFQDYGIGCGFHVVLKINQKSDAAFVGIYFDRIELYDEFFNYRREHIEEVLKSKLIWKREMTKGSAYFVSKKTQIEDKANWNKLVQWMMCTAVTIKRLFLSFYVGSR